MAVVPAALGAKARGDGLHTAKPPRAPELAEDVIALAAFGEGAQDDWRKLAPAEILRRCGLPPGPDRVLLARAVFVGTAQACLAGSFWAPAFGPDAAAVDIRHLARPVSALHAAGNKPPLEMLKVKGSGGPTITCMAHCHPLDAAAHFASAAGGGRSVAVVRCSSMREPRNEAAHHTHLKEDQLFLRTTYSRAFEKMSSDIAGPIGESLDSGGVIATSGVGVLRGPIEKGAPWLEDPPKVDIFWVAIEPRVQFGAEEDYAFLEDKTAMLQALDRAFGWAVAHGCDAIVLPPMGCCTQGCMHPRLDVGDAIFRTAQRYGRYMPEVCVASDNGNHFQGGWWEPFAEACQGGRAPFEVLPAVTPIPLPPYRLVPKDAQAMAEKLQKLASPRPGSQGRRPGSQGARKFGGKVTIR